MTDGYGSVLTILTVYQINLCSDLLDVIKFSYITILDSHC